MDAPSEAHVEVQAMDVGGDRRTALFLHPNAHVRFRLPSGGREAVLRSACGIKTLAWEAIASPIRFRVGVAGRRSVRWLWERTLDPRHSEDDRRWIDVELELGRAREFVLETTAERVDSAWSGWADPRLQLELPDRSVRARPRRVLLLVTADALRDDHVTGADVHTPHLDALASEAIRFSHARAVSSSTPGSYASLLTGTSPGRHGLVGEWGTLPLQLPNLATELQQAGWHTVFAPSEREVSRPEQGFARAFKETLPCLGNPSQDGEVTTRLVASRLERGDERALFVWAHYFDTHPPQPLPAGRVARYYVGDPRDPARSWETERVGAIRGAESVLELERTLPGLRAGRVDASLLCRLRDTARTLRGELEGGPDLAAHVTGLGPAARRGLELPEFGGWLATQADALAAGEVRPELVTWLEDVLPQLRSIERELLLWLDGVVDYRYPLAHVRAAASHLDAQVGSLVGQLRELGLYEDATILVCSPHGELYGEGGYHYTHHRLLEPVLRIPAILKPVAAAGVAPAEVGGVLDAVDLMPTLIELLGLEPPACDGRSRLAELRSGAPIAPHDSIAVGIDGVDACLVRPPYKLIRALGRRTLADGSSIEPGTSTWLDLESDAPGPPPADADDLERRLDELIRPASSEGRAANLVAAAPQRPTRRRGGS